VRWISHALFVGAMALTALACCAVTGAQSASDTKPAEARSAATANGGHAVFTFEFVRDAVGVPVPKYKVVIHEDGSATYEGEALPPRTRYGVAVSPESIPFHHDMNLSPATTARIFDLSAQLDHFNSTCASKAKNIADTGTKTVTYSGADGKGSCTYNFTEIKELASLTQLIQGIAETLDEGRELDRLHRYDRLGLDSVMTFFQQEVAAGRAIELQTISDSLRAITADNDLLARVRAKASALLTQVDAAK
jgi:hypothetical protein